MAKFDELNTNLITVLYKLLESQDLCKLLHYTSDNPFVEPDIPDTKVLLFNNIYPIPKIPNASDVKGSYLTAVFDEFILSSNSGYKDATLCFNVFCNIDLWQMKDTGKLRTYSIMEAIDKLLNNERVIGLGKMQFKRARFIFANDHYFGYRLDYEVVDFN